jgi:two-component sensor histidine kinase/Tfp pilus assembly protein PilF
MQKLLLIILFLIPYINWSQKSSQNLSNDEKKVLQLIATSKKFAPVHFDSSRIYAEKAIGLALKLENEHLLADSYVSKGLAFDYQSHLDSTLYWYDKALNIRTQQNNKPELVKLYNNYGVSYFYQGMYDRALVYYFESLKQSENLRDSIGIARSFNNMGLIYDKKGDWSKATTYFEKSLNIKRLLKDDAGLLFPLSNLSNIAFIQRDYSSAERYMLTNLQVSQKLNDSMQIGISYGVLAMIYASQGNDNKTFENVALCEKFIPFVNDAFELSLLYYNLGESLLLMNQWDKSENFLKKSLEISRKIKQSDLVLKTYKALQELSKKQGKLNESIQFYDLFTALNDSIFKENQGVEISKIEQLYQWEKKEQEIQLLNVNIAKATAQKRNWILGFAFLGILGAVVTGFFIINRRKSDELEKKNVQIQSALAENKTLMKEMNHRIKNNLQMISSMLHLQMHYTSQPEISNMLQETASRIQSISLIHQKLYAKDSVQQIDMQTYIKDIAHAVVQNSKEKDQINVQMEVQPLSMEIEKAQSIGLIVNELILNALKHAKIEEDILILEISLFEKEKLKTLVVSDNGKVEDHQPVDFTKSYGMQLIQSFVEKLDGKMEINREKGWKVIIKW